MLLLGGPIYNSVIVTVSGIVSAGGGMPQNVRDVYDPASNQLTIVAIALRGRVYTNAIVTVGGLVSLGGSSPTESLLHSFSGNQYGGSGASGHGETPFAGLIRGIDGSLHGTTYSGGASGKGAVYKITAPGVESVFYSFGTNSEDGSNATAGLIQDSGGNLYGTTSLGGAYDQGTVFRIDTTGTETVLHSFSGNDGLGGSADGANPESGLSADMDGNFYGSTTLGGANNKGTVFQLVDIVSNP